VRPPIARLTAAGLVSEALDYLRRLPAPTAEDITVQSELETIAANRDVALRLAQDVIRRGQPPHLIARALVVSARIQLYSGDSSQGQQQFLRARELANDSGDPSLAAYALGQHLESLLRYVSLEAAVGELSTYRRAAQRAGTHSSLGAMHRILAEAELKSGRGLRALRELELAELHAQALGDAVASAHLDLARSAAHGLLGDVSSALKFAIRGASIAKSCGAFAILRGLTLNAFHSQAAMAQFDGARASLAALKGLGPASISSSLDRASSELLMHVAIGDSEGASRIDEEFAPHASTRSSVSSRWYQLTRIAYLISQGRFDPAADLGMDCVKAAAPNSDRDFLTRLRLATAEAVVLSNRVHEAPHLISAASLGPLGNQPEFVATVQRACGRLSTDNSAAAFDQLHRSARIFGGISLVVGRGEALHAAATLRATRATAGSPEATVPHITTFYQKPPASFGRVDEPSDATPTTMPESVASAVRASAAMVDLTSRPSLAAYELLSLAAASGAADSAVMFARGADSVETLGWAGSEAPDLGLRHPPDDCVTFALGPERDREISVVVRPRNQQSARTTLIALQRLVLNGLTLHRAALAESEKSAIWPEPLPEQQLGLVCVAESMLELLRVTRRVAASHITVLVTGETGTGKELLARAIHNCSPRAKKPFIPFNCTAVPREMLDSQLFGYKRGAFTGALDNFPGVIRGAAGGTLFLDEIGEIGMDVQPKLLRFLESSDVHPLGESAPVNVDVRIVAATNANLDKMVAQGKFRDDLYYRLNVVKLTIPPLRERREEIPLLLDHFLERSMKEGSKTGIRIGETAAEFLLLYDWPGNVRELANEVRRAVALAESGAVLMPEHLSPRLAASRRTVPVGQRPPAPTELLVRRDQPLNAAVEHVERAFIQDALRIHGNVEDAARALGLSRKGLYLKRQRLRIDED
jgi:DNA-binding NtrC family response regulator